METQHSCGALIHAEMAIRLPVKDAQIPIAAWMRNMMDRHQLTPSSWAVKAKVARNTVSRAISDKYEHVTTTSTLVKLASVIQEPIPVTSGSSLRVEQQLSVETLEQAIDGILEVVMPDFDGRTAEVKRALALALRDTLAVLAVEPEAAADPQQARLVARSLAHRPRR